MKPLTDEEVKELTHSDRVPSYIIIGKCLKCGRCCELVNCEHLDKKTKRCKIYKNRPVCCRIHPPNRQAIRDANCKGFKCLRG